MSWERVEIAEIEVFLPHRCLFLHFHYLPQFHSFSFQFSLCCGEAAESSEGVEIIGKDINFTVSNSLRQRRFSHLFFCRLRVVTGELMRSHTFWTLYFLIAVGRCKNMFNCHRVFLPRHRAAKLLSTYWSSWTFIVLFNLQKDFHFKRVRALKSQRIELFALHSCDI